MKNVVPQRQTITVGELCQAIARGQVNATLDNNQCYQVSARDMRRLVRALQQQAPTSVEDRPRHLANA
ncbi:MAG TPA: hypothetical protein VH540_14935 [Ktedonobacterales bacterium]|jgi:hypothetical protein